MKKLTMASVAILAVVSGGLSASIVNTKHDITTNTTYDNTGNSDQQQVCVYCHTPHNSAAKGTSGPIWNRDYTNGAFTMYGAVGGSGSGRATADAPGAETLACLSCHDGTTAIDSLHNTPGAGAWSSNGEVIPTTSFAYVGTDLSDDHPVSLTYTPGNAGLRAVDSIGNMVLFTNANGSNQLECASCHQVHNDNLGSFLRVSAVDSAVCTACHDR